MDDIDISQPTVSRTLGCLFSPQICAQCIKFPLNLQEIPQQKKNQEVFFLKIAGFPGIGGAIDGTHVQFPLFVGQNANPPPLPPLGR